MATMPIFTELPMFRGSVYVIQFMLRYLGSYPLQWLAFNVSTPKSVTHRLRLLIKRDEPLRMRNPAGDENLSANVASSAGYKVRWKRLPFKEVSY